MRTLIISEKDIAARRISSILSDDRASNEKIGGVNVYEWNDGSDEYTCVGMRGHIITLDYPPELSRWSLRKLRDLVEATPVKGVDHDAKNIGDAIKKLSKEADRVIIATDYDREGELIGVEGLSLITGDGLPDSPVPTATGNGAKKSAKSTKAGKGKSKKASKRKPMPEPIKPVRPDNPPEIKRARFSALTKDEVKRAFSELADIDYNLAKSAEARQVVDLAWGAALTRFLSLSSGSRGSDFLSVGRVQSPTLAILVDREKEIRAFVPEPYWEVHATLAKGEEFRAMHTSGRFKEQAPAEAALVNVNRVDQGAITSVERKERTEKPPEPFNTTNFLRAATALGFSAARAMSVAEDLYTNGWISYPRTDNTVYPPSLNLKEVLQKFVKANGPFAQEAKDILDRGELKPTRGKKTTTDHPPITPYEVARGSDLNAEQWKVYELVVRRFLATLSPPAKEERLRVEFDLGGEPFYSTGRRLVEPGFRAVYHYSKGKDSLLPQMVEGETVQIRGAEVLSKETQPPKRYSQGKLIQEMENRGLGTKSTRAEIIDKLYKRDYVRNNPPEPTETGFAVLDALERYADTISRPDMTAALEREMDEIAEGERDFGTVITDSRSMLSQVMDELEENQPDIAKEIRAALQAKNTVGTCRQSGHALIIRRSRAGKRFVGCTGYPDCEQTYPLPQFGKVVAENEACPVCEAPVIRVIQAKKRPWITCLTMDCKGIEELQQRERDARRAEKEAAAAAKEAGEDQAAATVEPDPEDLGEVAEE